MLSRQDCITAIGQWGIAKSDYSQIKNLIPSASSFLFTYQDYQWLNTHNAFTYFHTYMGIHNQKLILIVVPLDQDGKEVILNSYLNLELTELQNNITIVEKKVITTINKTTLSTELKITNHRQEIQNPILNAPHLSEPMTLKDILLWEAQYLNWFYQQITVSNAQNVFNVFTVPSIDLDPSTINNGTIIHAFFGFKSNPIFLNVLPTLVFVSSGTNTNDGEIIQSNSADYSQPCPPMCKDLGSFKLLGQ